MFTLEKFIGFVLACIMAIAGVAALIVWLSTNTPWNGFMGICSLVVSAIMFHDYKREN